MVIRVEHNIGKQQLAKLGIDVWPTWEKKRSSFRWHYDAQETTYIVHGEVVVTPDGGTPVLIRSGDLVTFPAGLTCQWEIREDLLKHYRFD